MVKKALVFLIAALFLISGVQRAFAELSDVGPVNPQNGFPVWYQDSNGIAIELGLDPALNLFDPPITGNTFSEQIGFGAEGFYWIAENALDFPGGNLFYRANLEFAWVNEDPAPGDQFVFTRLRFRANVPAPGEYTVTHPYGVDTFTVDADTFAATAGVRAINVTLDVGGAAPDFRTALTGRVGPFLIAANPAPPAGFVGNGIAVTSTVSGSPFGTNFLRIQGPGGIDVQTDQFFVAGKLFTGQVNTPLGVQRATYERSAHNSVDVMATSTSTATVAVEGLTALPAAMTGDGTGKFYRHVHVAGDLPPTITVRADDDPLDPVIQPTGVIRNLVDLVQITRADYDVALRTLTIEAVSGDTVAPPVLTATGFGDLVAGSLVVSDVLVPPASLSVTSSLGGSDTRTISIVGHDVLPNSPPAAADDAANTIVDTAVVINVLANDVDIDGTINPLTLTLINPEGLNLVTNLDNTVTFTPVAGSIGAVTFSYTVQDDLGALSNAAAVSINVANAAPTPNIAPVAANDIANTIANTAVAIDLVANDTDADGLISPASVAIVTGPVSGALVNNGDGTVTYTPNNNFTGVDSFTYTVQDNAATPATSNAATVSVTVAPAETIVVTTSLFRTIGSRWIVSGTSTSLGATITVRLNGGATLGTANVSALGIWSIALRNSTIIPVAPATLRVESTGGGRLDNVAVTIRN